MRYSSVFLVNLFSFFVFVVGAVIVFFSWELGLAVMLASMGVACVSRYRISRTGFAGSLAVIPALLIFVYVYGAADRDAPVYFVNVSPTAWAIIAAGSAALILGLWLGGGSRQPEPKLGRLSFSGSELFFWVGVAAIVLSTVNYATGDIALLSDDINRTRFSGNYGVLGQFWALIHPVTQVSVIVFLLKLQQRRIDLRWTLLGIFSAISLILTGGRSLIAISLIAFGVLLLEIKRPRIQVVLLAMVVGLVAFGAIGQLRTTSLSFSAPPRTYSSTQGLESWIRTTDLSMQTGPRVLTLAIYHLHGKSLNGQFLVGDLPYLRGSSVTGSDRLVTGLLGRDTNVVGGLPPTFFGGLYLDFAWVGVIVGALLVGLLLTVSRRLVFRTPSLPAVVWFSYFAAYVLISGYSYLSLRPSWIVVLLMCIAAKFFSREADDPHSAHLEVQEVSGRGRASLI